MNKLNKSVVTLLCICLSIGLKAQEIEADLPKKEVNLKIYANLLFINPESNARYVLYDEETFKFWGITPAVSFRKREGIITHEFEPRYWVYTRDDGNIKQYELGLRYELCWYLKNDILPGLRFGWGVSSRIYYYNANVKTISFGFSSSNVVIQTGGIELAATLHLEYKIAKKLKIEFSFTNLNVNFEVEYFNSRSSGSGLGFTNTSSSLWVLGQSVLRLGLGYEL